ncbi:hypothetical protein [Acidovorax sp.]|uniref:hypothetical protein n=1 Tax=Acidovorax sp. TaxID=1872122 RepID=UPI00260BEEB2|nr:hypothetical protein [Acidovorax sp.]
MDEAQLLQCIVQHCGEACVVAPQDVAQRTLIGCDLIVAAGDESVSRLDPARSQADAAARQREQLLATLQGLATPSTSPALASAA